MNKLPNEMLVKIFSYFHPIYENLSRLAVVCRKWTTIIENSLLLWKHIHLDDNRHKYPGMENEYRKALCYCLVRFGRFVYCIRAEEETYFTEYEVRRLLPSLESLRSLDVPSMSWNTTFVKSLKCGPLLRKLTVDDHRALFSKWCKAAEDFAQFPKLHRRGVRVRDLKTFAKHFPKLETLKLSLNIFKLCNENLVSVLDQLHLRELSLECMPYGMTDVMYDQLYEMIPLRQLALSKHAQLLTNLEVRCLPISAQTLDLLVKHFTSLKSLIIGFSGVDDTVAPRKLILESKSLAIFMANGLPSSQIEDLVCVMPKLEVVAISECDNLLTIDLQANAVFFFVVNGNCKLNKISASSENIQTLHFLDCPSFSYENFQNFLTLNPTIERMELVTDWSELQLETKHCRSLTKLALRDTSTSLSRVQINCPTLRIFKCSGDLTPRKAAVLSRLVGNCELEINCEYVKKLQINDLVHLNRMNLRCSSAELIQIGGLQSANRSLDLKVRTSQRLDKICLNRVALGLIEIHSPEVRSVIMQSCALARGNVRSKIQFRCDSLGSLSLINCKKIRKFSLRVPRLTNLIIDSCSRLLNVELNVTNLKNVRVINCPLLQPVHETVNGKTKISAKKEPMYDMRVPYEKN